MRMRMNLLQAIAIATQLGFVLAAAVLIGLLGGSFLDSKLGTGPLFTIAGSVIGLAAGIYGGVQMLMFVLRRWPAGRQ